MFSEYCIAIKQCCPHVSNSIKLTNFSDNSKVKILDENQAISHTVWTYSRSRILFKPIYQGAEYCMVLCKTQITLWHLQPVNKLQLTSHTEKLGICFFVFRAYKQEKDMYTCLPTSSPTQGASDLSSSQSLGCASSSSVTKPLQSSGLCCLFFITYPVTAIIKTIHTAPDTPEPAMIRMCHGSVLLPGKQTASSCAYGK